MSQFSFSGSARPSMIIELVLVIPRSTGLDYKIGVPAALRKRKPRPPKAYRQGQRNQNARGRTGRWSVSPARRKQHKSGAVAQLGERLICIQEVAGSIPTSSTSSGLWPTGPRPITGL